MASDQEGRAATDAAVGGPGEVDARGEQGRRDGGERAFGALPGIVNDLPEVAPHEWIYLMS